MRNLLLCGIFLFVGGAVALAQDGSGDHVSKGPKNGTLMAVGGGLSDAIVDRFIELAGGSDASIVVIPTAGGADRYTDRVGAFLRQRGAKRITVLHTNDPEVANTDGFVAPLEDARGIWFGGGRQWRLVDAYAGTKTETMFWGVLERGGVIGGSSAGATIQGSYLARGDTKNNQIMMGDHEQGFGFLSNVTIDQHVLARNRQFDMFVILKEKPRLLGIGIDEKTAIIVQKDQLEVLGESYVLIYDNSFWSREGSELKQLPEKEARFYFLRSGDRYDLKRRSVLERRPRQDVMVRSPAEEAAPARRFRTRRELPPPNELLAPGSGRYDA